MELQNVKMQNAASSRVIPIIIPIIVNVKSIQLQTVVLMVTNAPSRMEPLNVKMVYAVSNRVMPIIIPIIIYVKSIRLQTAAHMAKHVPIRMA